MQKRYNSSRVQLNGCLKAIIGLFVIIIVHIPKLIWQLLLLSYAAVFNNRPNLTANPQEHLKRARRLLNRKHNSLLLYAALELRFCLERVAQEDMFIESISNKARKQYQPTKKVNALRRAEPDSEYEHRIILRHRDNGNEIDLGKYKPLDHERVRTIQGKLGDLLHPKVGIPLGMPDAEWYQDARSFLWETHDYLKSLLNDRRSYLGETDWGNTWEVKRVIDPSQ